jgi:hypothetical protein
MVCAIGRELSRALAHAVNARSEYHDVALVSEGDVRRERERLDDLWRAAMRAFQTHREQCSHCRNQGDVVAEAKN